MSRGWRLGRSVLSEPGAAGQRRWDEAGSGQAARHGAHGGRLIWGGQDVLRPPTHSFWAEAAAAQFLRPATHPWCSPTQWAWREKATLQTRGVACGRPLGHAEVWGQVSVGSMRGHGTDIAGKESWALRRVRRSGQR